MRARHLRAIASSGSRVAARFPASRPAMRTVCTASSKQEEELKPVSRISTTLEVIVSKIFPAGFGWQAASIVSSPPNEIESARAGRIVRARDASARDPLALAYSVTCGRSDDVRVPPKTLSLLPRRSPEIRDWRRTPWVLR